MRPVGALALAKHAPRSGARVLDVGCGHGESTLDLARLVGPRGSVVGLDTSEACIAVARREARAGEARNVTFVRGDANVFRVEESERFGLLFTRFGTSSLGGAESALRNVRATLEANGRLLIVAWRAAALNPWIAVAAEIALRHVRHRIAPIHEGPFLLADPDMSRTLLERAGYVEVSFEAIDAPVVIGQGVDEAIARQLDVGPVAELLRQAGVSGAACRDAVTRELRAALQPFVTARGVVMGSSVWLITARNPG